MSVCVCLVAQSCPTLCDLTDCSPPGSCVLGLSQSNILERVAISFSRGSSQPSNQICLSFVSCIAGRRPIQVVPVEWVPLPSLGDNMLDCLNAHRSLISCLTLSLVTLDSHLNGDTPTPQRRHDSNSGQWDQTQQCGHLVNHKSSVFSPTPSDQSLPFPKHVHVLSLSNGFDSPNSNTSLPRAQTYQSCLEWRRQGAEEKNNGALTGGAALSAAIGTGPAPVFLPAERASWFQCTVPGGVKGCCRAPRFVRAVDTRWSPCDGGWFPPYFSDSCKWEKHCGWTPLPKAWELHLFGEEAFCVVERAVLDPLVEWHIRPVKRTHYKEKKF